MVQWSLADTLAIALVVLDLWSILMAYTLTRLAAGAPRAWYFIIAAFCVLLIETIAQLYFDIQSSDNLISDTETSIALVVGLLLAIGLYLLLRVFQRQVKVANLGSVQT